MAATPEGCVAIQRNLNRLEKRADRNLMKFNQEKCKVQYLRRNKLMYHYIPGATQLERSFAEKGMGVLVDVKLNMSQLCAWQDRGADPPGNCAKAHGK